MIDIQFNFQFNLFHEQNMYKSSNELVRNMNNLVKHNNLNTKMNLHNDDDNVNDGDIHDIIIMLAYNLHAHIMAVLGNTCMYVYI